MPPGALGLFRLLTGQRRNLPVCHAGVIALLPDDERVPIVDWRDANPVESQRRRISVEAYLVEAQSMSGLSGSPVFVRSEIAVSLKGVVRLEGAGDPPNVILARDTVRLLGLWQGAWEAPPDEIRAAQSKRDLVPLGMGVVVPSTKIIELLETDAVKKRRDQFVAGRQPPADAPGAPRSDRPATRSRPSVTSFGCEVSLHARCH